MRIVDLTWALMQFPLAMRRGSARCIELFLHVADLEEQEVSFYAGCLGESQELTQHLLVELEHAYGLVAGRDGRYSLTGEGLMLAKRVTSAYLTEVRDGY
jgi:hypothetical protein